jgi:uncharacterized phiE125 gp8 family phage protein
MWTNGDAPDLAALDELKVFLRIEHDLEDGLLAALIRSAAATVEGWVGKHLVRREVEERAVPRDGFLRLTATPVVSLVEVGREEVDGTTTVLAAAATVLEIDRHGDGLVRVSAGDGRPHRVRYLAGAASDWNGVPEPLRLAVLRGAAHLYTYRDSSDDPGMPAAVRQLVAPWRSLRIS